MSKWMDVKTQLSHISCGDCHRGWGVEDCNFEGCSFGEAIGVAIEALDIAERLEHTDVEDAKNIYCQELSCDGLCDECDHLEDFADGYNRALVDVRGNTNE